MSLLLLAVGLLLLPAAHGERQAATVAFFLPEGAPSVLQLSWKRADGTLKLWSELHKGGDTRIRSFVGDTWVVQTPDGKRLREITLRQPGEQRIDASTGAAENKEAEEDAWGLGAAAEAYDFEFSPLKVAAERRVALVAGASAVEGRPEVAYGLTLSGGGVLLAMDAASPGADRVEAEHGTLRGATIVAVDGLPVEPSSPSSPSAPLDSIRLHLAAILARQASWREATLTVELAPALVPRKRPPLKDSPYLPPRSRTPALLPVRTARQYEAWEVEAGLSAAAVRALAPDPIVRTYRGFFSSDECAHVQSVAASKMRRATVSSAKGGKTMGGRTGDNAWLPHDTDDTVFAIVQRVADAVGLPADHAEPLQVVHYEQSEQ